MSRPQVPAELQPSTSILLSLSLFHGSLLTAHSGSRQLLCTSRPQVPAEMQSSTSILLSATAGLRLLPGNKADNILAAVRSYLASKTPFRVSPGAVSILDGKDEGAFAWMTLNYLLGHIGGEAGSTVAAIDLGGGSVQVRVAGFVMRWAIDSAFSSPRDD